MCYLSRIKAKVVINMCSHFNFSFIWRCCDVHKPYFFKRNQQKQPTISLNCTKHAGKQNSCVCWITKGSALYFGKLYLFAFVC